MADPHERHASRMQRAQGRVADISVEPNEKSLGSKIGKRIRRHQPASFIKRSSLPDFIHTIQIILFHIPARRPVATAVRTSTREEMAHTRLSHPICNLARPMGMPLCRMCFLFLHAQRTKVLLPANYIFKMKDLARHSRKTAESGPVSTSVPVLPKAQFVTISEEEAGQRIDNFLLRVCKGVPKSHLYRVLRSGEVRVNKGRIDQTYRLMEGDVVRIPPVKMAEASQAVVPGCEFDILHEDNHLLVINKPAGVAVHGGSGVSFGVIEQLRAARPEAKFLELVHRLDRDTSGILMLAKKRSALTNLHEQIREGLLDKRYLTLVHGDWNNRKQHVKLPLFKYTAADGERRVKVQADGLPSHTVFHLLRKYGEFALLEAELKTGRTHQIRVHLSASGFPIAGDDKYGDFALNRALQKQDGKRIALKRMFLHAHRITFTHPDTGEEMTLEAVLPSDCKRFIASLEEERPLSV